MKKRLLITLLSVIFYCSGFAQELTVGTYNIRLYSRSDSLNGNAWEKRRQAVVDLIKFNDFDIFGSQEVVHNQLEDMLKGLPEYAYIGVGRTDGKTAGEYSPVFYKKDKFKLLNSGYFWLSETPDKAGSFGWDAACERICTYGYFQEIETGFKFWFFTTHFDHIGVVARRESAKMILARIKDIGKNEPVIVTGDFNVNQFDESYLLLANSGVVSDSYEKASVRMAPNGTYNDWTVNQWNKERIDHIFISKDFRAERYAILTNLYWAENDDVARLPSDHFPVMAVLKYQ
ncbi:MAG: endonuclease/exonuclease/phosphatase family protein [Tannerella sp.]|jgi:endonuclease/exonuclease/phosphatase family metal-dependent hydrolase|nr:endonuclease/exonuclease/phosphatase family protein [Tannerella sp.]